MQDIHINDNIKPFLTFSQPSLRENVNKFLRPPSPTAGGFGG